MHSLSNRELFGIQPDERTEISHQATRAGFIAIGLAAAADRETAAERTLHSDRVKMFFC